MSKAIEQASILTCFMLCKGIEVFFMGVGLVARLLSRPDPKWRNQ